MKNELNAWSELTKLTKSEPIEVERVRIKSSGIVLEGRFELPALVQMPEEDHVFISAFLRCHGSIKEMERLFGISYPTVKSRLSRIAEQLPFVEVIEGANQEVPVEESLLSTDEVLQQLSMGKITSAQAAKLLRKNRRAQ